MRQHKTNKPDATLATAQPPRVYAEIIELAREALEYGRKDDQCLWRIGDALIKVCGAPGKVGVNDGSGDRMNAVAKELIREGLGERFSLAYLRKLRQTAHKFPDVNRLTTVPWTVHDLAGDPDTLAKMLEDAKQENKRLTSTAAKKQIARRKFAKKVKDKQDGKDDADTALRDGIDMATKALAGAIKLCELAKNADERISPHLPNLPERDKLIKAITSARDEAAKAVTALEALLQKVSAGQHETVH